MKGLVGSSRLVVAASLLLTAHVAAAQVISECTAAPGAPTGFTATVVSSTDVNLSWTEPPPPPGCDVTYTLYRSTVAGELGEPVAENSPYTFFWDNGLAPATTYYYMLQAETQWGWSDEWPSAQVTTPSAEACSEIPETPTGLVATARSTSQVDLSWASVPSPPGCSRMYALFRERTSDFTGGWGNLVAHSLTDTSYTDPNLAPSTTYYYVVQAYDSAGKSADSAKASATTRPAPIVCTAAPSAVTVSATPISSSRIDVSWTAATPPPGCSVSYALFMSTNSDFSSPTALASGLTATSYSATGLSPSTRYYFGVRASDSAGFADATPAGATTPSSATCTTVPSAPAGLTATARSPRQIDLSWSAVSPPSGCPAVTYAVYQATTDRFTPSDANRVAMNLSSPSYSSAGLTAATSYYFIVRAFDAAGASGNSSQASATTGADVTCTAVPTAPTGVTATALSTSQINLTWGSVTPPAGCSALTYAVHQSTDASFTPSDANRVATNLPTPGYSSTGLSPSTAYHFIVRAVDSAGASPGSTKASATTQAAAPTCTVVPTAPSVTATSFSSSQINLSWSAVSSPPGCSGVTYAVYQSTDASFTPSDSNRAAINLATTGYSSTGLSPSTTYYFVVRAVNAAGASPSSTRASAATQTAATCSAVPPAPSVTALPFSATQINLSWAAVSPPQGCPAVSYAVYQSTDAGFTPSDATRAAINLTAPGYSATGLSPGTTYTFVVRAFDAAGASPDSSKASAATPGGVATCSVAPSAPAGVVATARSSSGIDLGWTAVTPPPGCSVSYTVYQGTSGNFTPVDGNRVATGLSSPGYTVTGLSPSTTYHFVVRAVDGAGSSPDTARGSAKTAADDPTDPGRVGGCSALGTAGDAAGILLAVAGLALRARARKARGGGPGQ
jgi:predicted phage tail protein